MQLMLVKKFDPVSFFKSNIKLWKKMIQLARTLAASARTILTYLLKPDVILIIVLTK